MPELPGPDLTDGVDFATLVDGGMLLGHVRGEPVLLIRRGDVLFAIGAECTHYGAPLGEGLLVDETVRCPWHHACFSLRTGEVLRAPALDPVPCWRVEVMRDFVPPSTPGQRESRKVYVREKLGAQARRSQPLTNDLPKSVIIVGGGAAGNAAAETLRKEGYVGPITLLSADAALPCDRPILSKGYLAGSTPEESNILRSPQFYRDHEIDLRLGSRVTALDPINRQVELADGTRQHYGALLLATGADPVRIEAPGSDLPHLHYLRTLADSRALVSKARSSRRAVVVGASFIGLEVAASLRERNVEVQVVAPERIPMKKILGPEVGNFIRSLHELHGVAFHLDTTVAAIDERKVTLQNGKHLEADLVVVGIGVKPSISLAEQAGLVIESGVAVNEYLETSVPGIFAAGDIARWPDRLTGERIRVEHFVVAERQGQTAARNILGLRETFDAVPFFWTVQYDLGIGYIGHADNWDEAEIEGALEARDCSITYRSGGRKLAVAIIHRNLAGLHAELEFEKIIAA